MNDPAVNVMRAGWVVIDVETGDENIDAGPILSIGAYAEGLQPFHVVILPEPGWGAVSLAAAKVNGYPDNWDGAMTLRSAMERFKRWIERNITNPMPICHGKEFDRSFLEKAERLSGVRLHLGYRYRCSMAAILFVVDQVVTVAIDNGMRVIAEEWAAQRKVSLDATLKLLGMEKRSGHHSADRDAWLTMDVYEATVRGKTYDALWKDFEHYRVLNEGLEEHQRPRQ